MDEHPESIMDSLAELADRVEIFLHDVAATMPDCHNPVVELSRLDHEGTSRSAGQYLAGVWCMAAAVRASGGCGHSVLIAIDSWRKMVMDSIVE